MEYVYYISLSFYMLWALYCYHKLNSRTVELIAILIVVSWVAESIGFYYLKSYNRVNHLPFVIYHFIEYYLIARYFSIIFKNILLKKIAYRSIILVFVFFTLYEFLHITFSYLPTIVESLLISFLTVIACVLYFRQLLNVDIELSITHNPYFWICTGMLIFHAGGFILMGFINGLYNYDRELARRLFVINHILNIFHYGLLSYGLYLQWKQKKSS